MRPKSREETTGICIRTKIARTGTEGTSQAGHSPAFFCTASAWERGRSISAPARTTYPKMRYNCPMPRAAFPGSSPRGTLLTYASAYPHAKPHNNFLVCQSADAPAASETQAPRKRAAPAPTRPATYFLSRIALTLLVTFATCATALPAEAVIRIGDPNTTSLTTGLVGYWPLDGSVTKWATGQTQDLSGNSHTGQLINMSTSTSPTQGEMGERCISTESIHTSTVGILPIIYAVKVADWVGAGHRLGAPRRVRHDGSVCQHSTTAC